MKLSRRGKRTNHARRGKHTKRVRKHHTRRIKHRSKQYKRTYRKNNRKLKHNKRIQRGGWEWVTEGKNMVAKGVQLEYNKVGTVWWETNPFNIMLEYKGFNSIDKTHMFDVKMIRNTKPERIFELYFKLVTDKLTDKLYFSDEPQIFNIAAIQPFYLSLNGQSAFNEYLKCKTTYQVNYQFNTSNRLNKEFFNSLLQKMKEIQAAADADEKAASPPPVFVAPAAAASPPHVSADPLAASPPPVFVAPAAAASPPPVYTTQPTPDLSTVAYNIKRRRQNDEEKKEELNSLSQDRTCRDNSYQCRLYIAQYDKYVELIDDATLIKYSEISNNQTLSIDEKAVKKNDLYTARDNAINVFFEHTKKCLTDGSYPSYNDKEVLRNIVESTKALQPENDPDFFLNGISRVQIDEPNVNTCTNYRGEQYPCPPTGPPTTSYDVRTGGPRDQWTPSEIIPSNSTGSANGAADFYGRGNEHL